ncbi:hypothetical protein JOF53_006411 [Crossiella equi]|uniref:DUF4352 domain-containing protein n=1 Tax=Crossiella equi TaxID=130796 RepID=A0ABS5ALW4_9PSEU|nr:hypothetical protein [Crossiella equi]MBP2477539.1 hypothetical protein [Crossiella equi]
MTYPIPAAPEAPAQPPRPKFAGLAVASLVLGIIGVVFSWVIILNNVTAIAAGVGVVLGVVGLFGTRKVLAGVGIGLGVLGIVLTVVVQAAVVDALDKALQGTANQGQVSDASAKQGQEPPQEAEQPVTEAPTWGKRYTWKDGLAIEVGQPKACKPGRFSVPTSVERAVKFTVTVVNGTDKQFESGMLSVGTDAQFAGKEAQKVIDSNGPCGAGLDSGTVLPGKTFTFDVAYAVGKAPGEMQLTFQPSFLSDKAVFVGQA